MPDIGQDLRLQDLIRQPEEQEPACLGRRNVQKLIVQQRDLCAELRPQQRRLRLQPFLQRRVDRRPREADDARQTRDLLRLAPAGKGEEHVRPHHQPERIVRMLRGELAQRVDGIARPFAPQLHIADLEAVQPSDRQLRQREARLRVRRAVRQRLVRRNGSRNDDHAFQPQRRAALRRRQPMPFVRRVERPAVDPNVRHRTVLCLTMFYRIFDQTVWADDSVRPKAPSTKRGLSPKVTGGGFFSPLIAVGDLPPLRRGGLYALSRFPAVVFFARWRP